MFNIKFQDQTVALNSIVQFDKMYVITAGHLILKYFYIP